MMLSVLPSSITLPCLSPVVGMEELSAGSRAGGWRGMEAGAEMLVGRPGDSWQAGCLDGLREPCWNLVQTGELLSPSPVPPPASLSALPSLPSGSTAIIKS